MTLKEQKIDQQIFSENPDMTSGPLAKLSCIMNSGEIYFLYFSFYRQCVECVNQSKQCLEKTEGEIKNEQPRDIGNIGHTRRKTKKTNTT